MPKLSVQDESQSSDFSANVKTGNDHISQRKAAELIDIPRSTLRDSISKRSAERFIGLSNGVLSRNSTAKSSTRDREQDRIGMSESEFRSILCEYAAKGRPQAIAALTFLSGREGNAIELLSSKEFSAYQASQGKSKSKLSKPVAGYVYILECQGHYKIGRTNTSDAVDRVATLQCGNPFKINIVVVVSVGNCVRAEAFMHNKYKSKRGLGEWFKLDSNELEEAQETLKSM